MNYLRMNLLMNYIKKKVDTKSRKNREYLEREFDDSLNIINPLLDTIKKN